MQVVLLLRLRQALQIRRTLIALLSAALVATIVATRMGSASFSAAEADLYQRYSLNLE